MTITATGFGGATANGANTNLNPGSLASAAGDRVIVVYAWFASTTAVSQAAGTVTSTPAKTFTKDTDFTSGSMGLAVYSWVSDGTTLTQINVAPTLSGGFIANVAGSTTKVAATAGTVTYDGTTKGTGTDATSPLAWSAGGAITGTQIGFIGAVIDNGVSGAFTTSTGYTMIQEQADGSLSLTNHEAFKVNESGTPSLSVAYSAAITAAIELFVSFKEPGATAPSAPSELRAVAENDGASLVWPTPADGGSPITDYLVEKNVNSGGWTTITHSAFTASEFHVTGLTTTDSVIFRVSAINAVGTSSASPTSPAITVLGIHSIAHIFTTLLGRYLNPPSNRGMWDTGLKNNKRPEARLSTSSNAAAEGTAWDTAGAGVAIDFLWASATTNATVTPGVLATPISFKTVTIISSPTTSPATLATPVTFPTPTVFGGTTTAPATLATPIVFRALTVVSSPTTSPAVLATPIVFRSQTVVSSPVVAPSTLATPITITTPAVTSSPTVAPTVLATPVTFPAPTVLLSPTVLPSSLATPITFPAPTVTSSPTVTTATITTPIAFAAPTVISSPAVTPPTLATPVSFLAPSVVAGTIVSPPALATPIVFRTVTILLSPTITPAVLATPVTFPAPTVTTGTTTSPSTLATPISFKTVTIISSPTVTPASLATPIVILALVATSSPTVTPATLATPIVFRSVVTTTSPTVTPATLATPITFRSPTLAASSTAFAGTLATPIVILAPTVTAGVPPVTDVTGTATVTITGGVGVSIQLRAPFTGVETTSSTSGIQLAGPHAALEMIP